MAEKFKVLVKSGDIRRRVGELAASLREWAGSADSPVCAVWLAEGAMFFAADLLRGMAGCGLEIHSARVSSYGNSLGAEGEPRVLSPLPDAAGMRVLIIDDVLDSGKTAAKISGAFREGGAAEVKLCVLLDKRTGAEKFAKADFAGFEIGNDFAFGYGMDLRGKMRELPDIMALVQTGAQKCV